MKGFEVRLHEIRGPHGCEPPQRPQYALVITRDELHRGMSEACYVKLTRIINLATCK